MKINTLPVIIEIYFWQIVTKTIASSPHLQKSLHELYLLKQNQKLNVFAVLAAACACSGLIAGFIFGAIGAYIW
jgi:hypothetical protein